MPMGQPTDRFEVSCGYPVVRYPRPRLWRLGMGLACALAAWAVLPGVGPLARLEGLQAVAPAHLSMASALLLAMALFQGVRALASELFRLHSVSIDRQGLWVYWSHAPELLGPHRPEHRFVPWAEVAQLAWEEDGQEHEFKQYLLVTLHTPLSRRRRRLKLRMCDERDLVRCQALMALLPAGTPHPAWLDGQRSRWPVVASPAPCPATEPLV